MSLPPSFYSTIGSPEPPGASSSPDSSVVSGVACPCVAGSGPRRGGPGSGSSGGGTADASSNGSGGGSCRPVTTFSGGGPVGVAGSGAGSGAGAGAGGRSGSGAGGSQATGSAGRAGSGRRVGAAGPPTPAPPAATRTSTPRTSWIAPATTWSLPLLVKPLASFGREKPSRTVLPSTPTGPT